MIPSKYLLGIAILLFISLSFYTVESFIQSNATRTIELQDSSPIIRIEIVYKGPPKKETFLHLADLQLIDTKDKVIQYWKPPNSVHFEQGDTGFKGKTGPNHGPIEKLYDGDINTFAHASVAPDKLTILLRPYGENIKTIQITNRKDCCETRIKPYEMHLYSNQQRSGTIPLVELGERGKSITYVLIQPSIKTTDVLATKEQVEFNKNWDKMVATLPVEQEVQARPYIPENSANAAQLYDSRSTGTNTGSGNSYNWKNPSRPSTTSGSYAGSSSGANAPTNANANAGTSGASYNSYGAADTVTGAASYTSYGNNTTTGAASYTSNGTNPGTGSNESNPKDCKRYGPNYSTPESRNGQGLDTIPGGPDGTHRVRVSKPDSETCE